MSCICNIIIYAGLFCLGALSLAGIAFGLYWLGCAGISAGRAVAMWIERRV